jgi:hypothetical protein
MAPEVCDACGAVIPDGTERLYAFVPDSSALRASSRSRDGWRWLVACCAEHMLHLVRWYEHRPFVEAEQWAAKIVRGLADDQTCDEATLMELTGLTADQIRQGVAFRDARTGSG